MADPVAVTAELDALLDRLGEGGAVALTAVSSLAEGADRLLAWRVLARAEGRLVALLPLDAVDFATDFESAPSVREFNELLAAADEVQVIPTDPADASREAAYERAGLAVLSGCDVLVALWDGEPSRGRGGTAELVAEARRSGHPVQVVQVVR